MKRKILAALLAAVLLSGCVTIEVTEGMFIEISTDHFIEIVIQYPNDDSGTETGKEAK